MGLKQSSDLVVRQGLIDKIAKFFGFNLDSTSGTIYDVKAVAINAENEIVGSTDLGDLAGGGIAESILYGHSGTDILFGRGGNDIYRAGDGVDWISLSHWG